MGEIIRGFYDAANEKRIQINDLMDISRENDETIAIHLPNLKNQQSWTENFALVQEGFKKIAHLLERRLEYRPVQEIVAFSGLTREHPEAAAYFGFHIDDGTHPLTAQMRRKYFASKIIGRLLKEKLSANPVLAKMSRAEFLHRFGGYNPDTSALLDTLL